MQGILTTSSSHGEYVSTTQDAYAPVPWQVVSHVEGKRQRQLREQLCEAVAAQLQEDIDLLAQQKPTLVSTTHHDFTSNGIRYTLVVL